MAKVGVGIVTFDYGNLLGYLLSNKINSSYLGSVEKYF
jgi:hypothetical protein